MNSLTVADRRVVPHMLRESVPAGWRQSPLLRHHRLVQLDDKNQSAVGPYVLKLDDEVGLVIARQGTE